MSTQHWPSWWYGPDGKGAVFASADEVPRGWKDHPSKHGPQDPEPAPVAKTNSRAPAKRAAPKKVGRKPAAKPAAPLDL